MWRDTKQAHSKRDRSKRYDETRIQLTFSFGGFRWYFGHIRHVRSWSLYFGYDTSGTEESRLYQAEGSKSEKGQADTIGNKVGESERRQTSCSRRYKLVMLLFMLFVCSVVFVGFLLWGGGYIGMVCVWKWWFDCLHWIYIIIWFLEIHWLCNKTLSFHRKI